MNGRGKCFIERVNHEMKPCATSVDIWFEWIMQPACGFLK